MGSFFVILHPRIGGPGGGQRRRACAQAPLIGLGLGLLAVHLLAEPVGVWWSYAIGLERRSRLERAAVAVRAGSG